ncbi:hypothetical protein FNV43_RR26130 [Rhamnella rubrinervis]|uniref:AMP-activated protein kinase glycogen-binding domain-containing protein n=1 Tax=Rhamnella rubrinervis TaxID=2594499 RepID=A0A8K0DNH6_9ROSA|nr:hypothetical protein FNV43_RR26130 [Rhamnella rubrinervis]
MHSFTTPSASLRVLSPQPSPSAVSVVKPIIRRRQRRFLALNFVWDKENRCSCEGLYRFEKVRGHDKGLFCGFHGFVRRCKNWDGEGDSELEAEILEFMVNSEKPEVFPSKKELVDAGRMDLVDAIRKRGGWLSFGWDLDEENDCSDSGSLAAKGRDSFQESNAGASQEMLDSGVVYSFSEGSSHSASSSGRSLEMPTTEDEIGIEGILSRLQKQRNLTFGLSLDGKDDRTYFPSNGGKNDQHPKISNDVTVTGLTKSSELTSLGPEKTLKPEMWRAWIAQRAGFPAAEFSSDEISMKASKDVSKEEIIGIRESASEPNERNELNLHLEETNHNQIRNRLQDLESELSSALHLLRSNADKIAPQKGHENSSEDLQELSDAWEFQENEIMSAQDKLRSIRAKLSVLEGKMALAIIDAQKVVENKQKRVDDARRALRLFRNTCIVWPNSASEVLLAGSFDGWATQRKMEKSKTGIFSVCMQLYPGKYEIKFIVDGEWRVDPLRPIVQNNGHENNLLIIQLS